MRLAPLAFVIAAALAGPALAQTMPLPPKIAAPSGRYAIDPTHASVTMTWRHMGLEGTSNNGDFVLRWAA